MHYLKRYNDITKAWVFILALYLLFMCSPHIVFAADEVPILNRMYCTLDATKSILTVISIFGVMASSVMVVIGKMAWPTYTVTMIGVILIANATEIVGFLIGDTIEVVCV